MNEEKILEWIEKASYEDLLRHWRTAPAGDPCFQGETGLYFQEVMEQKRADLTMEEKVEISKKIWNENTRKGT